MTYTLYDGVPPHEKTQTSRDAAISIEKSSKSMRYKVYRTIADAPDGMTDDGIEAVTGLRHQTASARRRELVLLGLVSDSGRRRRTRSGRTAVVWEVTDRNLQIMFPGQ